MINADASQKVIKQLDFDILMFFYNKGLKYRFYITKKPVTLVTGFFFLPYV
jgi:hypothetical protein